MIENKEEGWEKRNDIFKGEFKCSIICNMTVAKEKPPLVNEKANTQVLSSQLILLLYLHTLKWQHQRQ